MIRLKTSTSRYYNDEAKHQKRKKSPKNINDLDDTIILDSTAKKQRGLGATALSPYGSERVIVRQIHVNDTQGTGTAHPRPIFDPQIVLDRFRSNAQKGPIQIEDGQGLFRSGKNREKQRLSVNKLYNIFLNGHSDMGENMNTQMITDGEYLIDNRLGGFEFTCELKKTLNNTEQESDFSH